MHPGSLHLHPRLDSSRGGIKARRMVARLLVGLVAIPSTAALMIASAASTQAAVAVRPANTSGAMAVGTAIYPVPSGAVFVSPSGNDSGPGGFGSPVRSIARALVLAPSGGTVILRGGNYHESVLIQTKPVTIQNYPHEAAWLDGASPVTGWVASGKVWRKDGWTARFDHSPTYNRGKADGTSVGWRFVNPAYPMAAHPDQLWINGVVMRQVATLASVASGTFYLNESTSQLYVGSSPVGHLALATTIAKAISVRVAGVVLRGFGVTRFGPSVWNMGAITLERPNIVVENLAVTFMATTGISATSSGITLRRVSVAKSGLLGIHASGADHLSLISVASIYNNTERFNMAPVSGGFKITASRGIVIKYSSFTGNYGTGGWFDVSNYGMTVVGNNFRANSSHGMFFEISSHALFADNLVLGNVGDGVKINDTSYVTVWNNTFVGNGRPIDIVQDARRASPVTTANLGMHDRRQRLPDPTVTWLVGPVSVGNNVMGAQRSSGRCMLCVEDYSHKRTAAQMGVRSNGNVYNRPRGAPLWSNIWSRGSVNPNPSVFTTVRLFSTATGQDRSRYAVDRGSIVSSLGVPTAAVTRSARVVAQVLPTIVAAAMGRSAYMRHLGAWL